MNYKIGQRVRLKVSLRYPALVGITGRVVSPLQSPTPARRPPPYDAKEPVHQVEFDHPPEWTNRWKRWYAAPWQLEPILPEGMDKVEWADCLWQPEHLREQAGKA